MLRGRGRQGQWQQVHQKRRRLSNLKFRLVGAGSRPCGRTGAAVLRLQEVVAAGSITLEANGYASHEAWLEEWRDVRSNEFFVLGSSG